MPGLSEILLAVAGALCLLLLERKYFGPPKPWRTRAIKVAKLRGLDIQLRFGTAMKMKQRERAVQFGDGRVSYLYGWAPVEVGVVKAAFTWDGNISREDIMICEIEPNV